MATVLLIRRTLSDLSSQEFDAIRQALQGQNLDFVSTSPAHHIAHKAECDARHPALVVLPPQTPLHESAMKAGHRHAIFVDGKLQRLVRIEMVLEPLGPTTT